METFSAALPFDDLRYMSLLPPVQAVQFSSSACSEGSGLLRTASRGYVNLEQVERFTVSGKTVDPTVTFTFASGEVLTTTVLRSDLAAFIDNRPAERLNDAA